MCNQTADIKSIMESLVGGIPEDFPDLARKRWANSGQLLQARVQALLLDDGSRTVGEMLKQGEIFYADIFGLKKDFSGLSIPTPPPGLNWLFVRAREIPLTKIMDALYKRFPTRYHPLGEFGDNDLDGTTRNDDRPAGDYAFWLARVTEAEVSPPTNITTPPSPRLTLEERLLAELGHHAETGIHLDNDRVTCCFGTRSNEGGERPVVCYREGSVQIYWQADQFNTTVMHCSPYWTRQVSF